MGSRVRTQGLTEEGSNFGDGRFELAEVPTILRRGLLAVRAPKQVLGGLARCLTQSHLNRRKSK